MQTRSTFSRGYVLALTTVILWSFSGILISYLSVTYEVPSVVIAFWSVLFVALGMLTALTLFSHERFNPDRSHLKFLALYGFTFAVFHTMALSFCVGEKRPNNRHPVG